VKKFIVSDKTINRVLTWVVENDAGATWLEDEAAESLARLGTSMLELNCDAIDQLCGYGEAAEYRPLDYEFQWSGRRRSRCSSRCNAGSSNVLATESRRRICIAK